MMLHCNMKLVWQSSYAMIFRSKAFHPCGVVNLDGGGGRGEPLQRADKIA
jgi:hypothetical protein